MDGSGAGRVTGVSTTGWSSVPSIIKLPLLLMLTSGLIFTIDPAPIVRVTLAGIVRLATSAIRELAGHVVLAASVPEIVVQVVLGSMVICLCAERVVVVAP